MNEIYTEREFKELSNLGFFHRRSNIKLALIDSLLHEYHQNIASDKKVTLLVNIVKACQDFYHAKPQNGRVKAVIDLHFNALELAKKLIKQKITSHSLGFGRQGWQRVKMALSPIITGANSKTKILSEEYWPEAFITEHFPQRDIANSKNPFDLWKESVSKLNYVEWLQEYYIPKMVDINKGGSLILRFYHNVRYLDNQQREEKELYIKNGLFYNCLGDKFHTGSMSTNVAGEGWAIYVQSNKNKLYAASHQRNMFHHSSFLSGAPVKAAGELAINNGKLVGITSKSGHYKPDASHFFALLNFLTLNRVSLHGVAACHITRGNLQIFYDAQELMDKKETSSLASVPIPRVI